MESEAGYYHLLVGLLGTEYEDERSYVRMYGFTEILPGRVTTDLILSADGLNFFNLITGAFRAGRFDSNGNMIAGIVPTNTSYWNMYGASFVSLATGLFFAEKALIAGFNFDENVIESSKLDSNNQPVIVLDGFNGLIQMEGDHSGGESSTEDNPSRMKIDASQGLFEARSKSSGRIAYMSPTGVFCNNPQTAALPISSGWSHKAAMVGHGYATSPVNLDYVGQNPESKIVAGSYGRASNSGSAPAVGVYGDATNSVGPAYGGFFRNLMAKGFSIIFDKVFRE